jgi:hypothetical protein
MLRSTTSGFECGKVKGNRGGEEERKRQQITLKAEQTDPQQDGGQSTLYVPEAAILRPNDGYV